jgi:hypothetical protein
MKFGYEDAILTGLAVVAILVGIVATILWRDDLFYGWRKSSLLAKAFFITMSPLLAAWNGFVITYHVLVSAFFLVIFGLPALLIDFLFPAKPPAPRSPEKYVPPSQKRTLRHPLEFFVETRRIAKNRVLKGLREKGTNPQYVSSAEINAAVKRMLEADWISIRTDAEMSFHENALLAKLKSIDKYGLR